MDNITNTKKGIPIWLIGIAIMELVLIVLFVVGYFAYEQKVLNETSQVQGDCVVVPEIIINNSFSYSSPNSDVPVDIRK